jgi:hypothetical protein
MAKQGSLATNSGNVLEQTVKTIFTAKRFSILRYRDWNKNPNKYGKELLLINAPFTTIYQHSGTTEFRLLSQRYKMDIRIECKWQQVSGSVDEKLPYLYLNCIEAMPEKNIIIIIDGDGWKKGAITWLKDAVKRKKYTSAQNVKKIIRVMDLKEFITWANNTFR